MSDAWDASSISREKRASLLAVRLKRKKDDGWCLADSSKKRKSRAPAADSADDDSFSPQDVAAATSMVLCAVPEYNRMILVGSDCVGLGGDERRLRNAAPECHGRRVAVMCFSTLVSATTFAACCLPVLHAVLPHACVGANPKAGPFRRYAVLS